MKHLYIFFITVFMCLNAYGQNTYIGKIIFVSNPCQADPCLPGMLFGLQTTSDNYVLTVNSNWIWSDSQLIVGDVEFFMDDDVEISGIITVKQDINSNEYIELEIKSISKQTSNQDIQRFSGTYHLEGECEDMTVDGFVFPDERDIVIREDESTESDLLINIGASAQFNDFKAYISGDSLFIPLQFWTNFDDTQASFQGKGKVENDSLFLSYSTGGSFGVFDCKCKGKRISTGMVFPFVSDLNKIYYHAANQSIIIDKTFQNQSFNFELINLHGKVILSEANVGGSVNISEIPDGIYLCRILQNGVTACSGKILKR